MFTLKSRSDLATGTGGREEAKGSRSGRDGAEGGDEGTVDGDTDGARLGKEGQMPHGVVRFEKNKTKKTEFYDQN